MPAFELDYDVFDDERGAGIRVRTRPGTGRKCRNTHLTIHLDNLRLALSVRLSVQALLERQRSANEGIHRRA